MVDLSPEERITVLWCLRRMKQRKTRDYEKSKTADQRAANAKRVTSISSSLRKLEAEWPDLKEIKL